MTLQRIGVWSAARILGALYAGIGLVFGAVASVVGLASVLLGSSTQDGVGGLSGVLFGVGAILMLPILYGLLGLAGGALTAALYNLFAGLMGGVELEFEPRSNA
jgi:hypothetical protein